MPTSQVFQQALDTGVGSQTLTYNLDAIDLSRADSLTMTTAITKAITDAGDTLNIYLQSRGPDGIWFDRIATRQFIGTMTVSTTAPETDVSTLQQFGSLSDTEESSEPSGSAGASHITAGTVRNGPFPRKYRARSGTAEATAWRLVVVVVDADNDADFEGTVYVMINSVF